MKVKDISFLPPRDETAVIINVGTKAVTTLALLSTLRHAGMRVVLIDCESKDGSLEHFSALMDSYDFDLVTAPLLRHGQTLDWLFTNIKATKVLLVDSDVEILDPGIISWMKGFINDEKVFGSGFVHGPSWMEGVFPAGGYYAERMWIPLTLLKAAVIKNLIDMGYSFMDRRFYNDFPYWQFLSHVLFQRHRISFLRGRSFTWLNPLKQSFDGQKPSYVQFDTGGEIYQVLKYRQGFDFIGYPARLHESFVKHYHGVTRLMLSEIDDNGTELSDVVPEIEKRLEEVYNMKV